MERDVQAGEEDQTERFHSVERPQLERRHHRRCLVRMEDLPEVQTMTNGKTEYTIPGTRCNKRSCTGDFHCFPQKRPPLFNIHTPLSDLPQVNASQSLSCACSNRPQSPTHYMSTQAIMTDGDKRVFVKRSVIVSFSPLFYSQISDL